MKQKLLIGLFATCALALCATNTMAAKGKVYTWTDDKGVVHYGERPPKDSQAALVKTRSGHSDPTPTASPNTSATQSSVATTTTRPAGDPERCQKAQENLKVLNNAARIRTQNADGVMVYLSEDDKAEQRRQMEEIIAQECN